MVTDAISDYFFVTDSVRIFPLPIYHPPISGSRSYPGTDAGDFFGGGVSGEDSHHAGFEPVSHADRGVDGDARADGAKIHRGTRFLGLCDHELPGSSGAIRELLHGLLRKPAEGRVDPFARDLPARRRLGVQGGGGGDHSRGRARENGDR